MASLSFKVAFVFIFGLCCLGSECSAHPLAFLTKKCKFDQIYQLGDSINDAGNLIRELPIGAATAFARLPYGQTLFKNATGRCSNGLLMIDYFALASGVPLVPPYKSMGSEFGHGVNFAVAGSTALPSEVLAAQRVFNPVTNSSLNVQLDWMSSHLDSICLDQKDCSEKLQSALFLVGETGGNDYNYAIFQGKQMEELIGMIPHVVAAVIDAARKVIEMGAARLVVPGNFPIGCLPIYKTAFESNITAAYDENQCLRQLNRLAIYHNHRLQQALAELRQEKPNAVIVYGDYYNAYQYLLRFAKRHGYELEKACCGTGGKYNFSLTRMCGAPNVTVCEDAARHLSWDGVHMTQQGYKIMANWLIANNFVNLRCQPY